MKTFLPKERDGEIATEIELIRSTEGEKGQQIKNVAWWGNPPIFNGRQKGRKAYS